LQGAGDEQAAEARLVLEQLDVRLGLVLVLEGDGVLDRLELGLDPRVGGVAVGVQLGERLQAKVGLAVVDQPAWGLGEQKDEGAEEDGGDDLNTERGAPLSVVIGSEADVRAWKQSKSGVDIPCVK
jgi:hypothetical protein